MKVLSLPMRMPYKFQKGRPYYAHKIEVACWAHARRKFFDASGTDGKRSAQMLRFVQWLYAIEDRIKQRLEKRLKNNPQMTAKERHEIIRQSRQARSKPILTKIKIWLDTEKELVLPRSPMAQAIGYTLNQWEALCRYTEQGFLNIDNNAAERALKRVAIGRNYAQPGIMRSPPPPAVIPHRWDRHPPREQCRARSA